MSGRFRALAAALALLLALVLYPASAAAEPINIHVEVDSQLKTKDSTIDLPPVYILSEDLRKALDEEVKRLQNKETQCDAENASLKENCGCSKVLPVTLLVLGFIGGFVTAIVYENVK